MESESNMCQHPEQEEFLLEKAASENAPKNPKVQYFEEEREHDLWQGGSE